MSEKKPLRVGFLGFEGLMALDLVGPIDAFTSAFNEDGKGEMTSCYEVVIIGLTGQRRYGLQPSSYRKHFSLHAREGV